MTTAELHKILDDKDKRITVEELRDIVYTLKEDCFNEQCKLDPISRDYRYYAGEVNAFYIVLDLLEHIG